MSPGTKFIDGIFEELEREEEAEATAARPIVIAVPAGTSRGEIARLARDARPRLPLTPPPSRTPVTAENLAAGLRHLRGPQPMPLLPARVEPATPPPAPPLLTGHRTAPLALTRTGDTTPRPPRAPWYRRWWAAFRGLEKRRDLSRRRRVIHVYFPQASWAQCQEAARLARKADHSAGLTHAFDTCSLGNFLDTMGRRAVPPEGTPAILCDTTAEELLKRARLRTGPDYVPTLPWLGPRTLPLPAPETPVKR